MQKETAKKNGDSLENQVKKNNLTNGGRLLILDDEINILRALERIFRNRGLVVHTAVNVEIAERLVEMFPFDVIIADYKLPTSNGLDFLNKVRRSKPWIRGVLITAYQEGLARSFHTIEGSIYPFIEKPWDDDELIQWVETLLQMSRNLRVQSEKQS